MVELISPQKQMPTPAKTTSVIHILFGYDTVLSSYSSRFMESLKKQLQDGGVKVVVDMAGQTSSEQIAAPDINLYLQSNQSEPGGKVRATSYPLRQKLSEISPLLYNSFQGLEWKLLYEQNDPRASQLILNFVTGLSFYVTKDCDLADMYFAKVEETAPTLALETTNLKSSVQFYRGNCALIAGDFETAARFYEISRASKPTLSLFTDASAVNLAWVDIKLGRSDDAFKLMDAEVARFDPQNSLFALTAFEQRSQLHALAFQYDAAIADLDLAIQYCLSSSRVTPTYCARYYTRRGQSYLLLYEWDKVAADYNKALELDPTYADAYFYRGVLYYSILQTGQAMYNDALADFQHYLELAPNGEHAADATRYATDIQTQMNALNN